jgi:hypothetical protein
MIRYIKCVGKVFYVHKLITSSTDSSGHKIAKYLLNSANARFIISPISPLTSLLVGLLYKLTLHKIK